MAPGDEMAIPRSPAVIPQARIGARAQELVIVGAGAALAFAGIAASLTADAPAEARARYAVLNALMILVPIGVGVYATQRAAHRRFGRFLIAAGLVWSTAALAQADSSLAYSVGRVSGWVVIALIVWLILSYPTGRLATKRDRVLGFAIVALLVLLYIPTALLVEAFPTQTPWSACRTDCPANAFMVLDREPAFVDDVVIPLRELLQMGILIGVIARLVARIRGASAPQRRMLVPVLGVALLLLTMYVAFLALRRAEPGLGVVDILGWSVALCVPGVALGFLAGLVSWRLYTARALQRLAVAARRRPNAAELRATLTEALEDPCVRLAWRRDGEWVDDDGAPAPPPAAGPGEATTELRGDAGLLAVMVHDEALADDEEFLAAVAATAASALEHGRLETTVAAAQREVEASRSRALAEADDERRRLEHDLHDGAQQRLVALAIRLELERERLSAGDGAAAFDGFADEVEEILDEIRALARGVHPTLLRDRGLQAALEAAAARAPLPVHVTADDVGRRPPGLESAVYFACLEALQNAVKHARDATGVWIALRDGDGTLRFEVCDDGAGFDERAQPPGVGLAGMRERLAAVGGTLEIASAPGGGTRVAGTVPAG